MVQDVMGRDIPGRNDNRETDQAGEHRRNQHGAHLRSFNPVLFECRHRKRIAGRIQLETTQILHDLVFSNSWTNWIMPVSTAIGIAEMLQIVHRSQVAVPNGTQNTAI